MIEVEMSYTKKEMLIVLMTVLCAAIANLSFADVTADSIMFRRKPVASAPVAQRQAPEKPVAAAPVVQTQAPEKSVEPVKVADVSVEKPAAQKPAPKVEKPAPKAVEKKSEKKAEKKEKKTPQRDAIITADRTDYDRKEGVVLFDRNVHVDDEQYQMHTDRLFLFLDGTNDLKRLVAIGNVAITNENRRAYCARATFNKKLGRIVMYSSDEITAFLCEEGKKGSEVKGEKITFWIDSEQVEVENPVITMPGGLGGGGNDGLKKALGR
jgi:lipopolysaccharide transport protein LptA